MIRKLIHIDEDKCNGCGICASACHEGAIGIVDGKAKLLRDDYCDGMGDCLPTCPTGAISFEEREAAAYDEAAVQENKKKKELQEKMKHMHEGGCPGSRVRMMQHAEEATATASAHVMMPSACSSWYRTGSSITSVLAWFVNIIRSLSASVPEASAFRN